ncbi:DUF262 domain-containing protein [Clostridium botulinum]|uniref:DUF262 domain-containing protein n=1 Tax=Clostridium botulinum TaxID=1491 RepID=A0AA43Y835_CLOBO|nr:DUF262 domain-containing protein [Clostridium botulinum]AVQ37490.1 DUF262 domain-containing protein [Clostridium botulinum]NFB93627.1 DUF262 domain-containing protein [Clostridium botulinum]NFI06365.1 DUF262 domain-containing protein [Clostridium botulinum]NFI21943.1 DUF262 domain-containing protein [Clostridium botulinum]NFQ77812.1 DUF262 domain-containing protein [Clostridium botulinum]
MKANEKLLIRFLESSDTNFVIPVYQRNYDWQKEHCKQLYDDCISVIKSKYATHFFGTIVSIYNESGRNREYLIIDGQQRITTVSLMLLAIYNILKSGRLNANGIIKEKIMNQYLINQYIEDDRKLKLRPIKDDRVAFEKLFDDEYIADSNITLNYQYFYNRILEGEISIDEIYSAIEKLMIVEIELKNGEDDPQLIFESLNSTGLDLSDADKVRNFILMGQSFKKQEELYNRYWNKVEKNTLYGVTNFIRDYMTMKENKISNINKIYVNFKRYINENNIDIEICLKDMLLFSKYYNKILTNTVGIREVDKKLQRINKLEVTVLYPFLLEVFYDYFNDLINDTQLIEIVAILESYIFRRIMCGVATNALNKVFMNLGKEIKKHEQYKEKYVDILKYILINKKSTQRMPNDKEFQKNFYEENVYSWKSKNKIYLLERLENYKNNERVDIERLIETNELTIEHIMPQELNKNWREMLGQGFEEIHNKYLHTIGNLTLTGYNSSMSNRSFYDKKNMKNGFKDSRLKLNKYLVLADKWNEKSILKRTELLFSIALDIWQYPSTNYVEERPIDNLYSLADEDDFTNTKVKSFIFMGDEYKVKNWTELYEKICIILYEIEPSIFVKLITKKFPEEHIEKRFSNNERDLRTALKISDKVFIEKNLNTESKLTTLRVIFNEYRLDYNELTFYIV